jgi:hypothetical protein
MKKQNEEKQNNIVALREDSHLPESVSKYSQYAGAGTSQAADDNVTPLVTVIQANSPQLIRGGPKYIEGAKAGDIMIPNSPVPLIDGMTGMWFQPCFYYREVVEWTPRNRGGGVRGRHREMPREAVEKALDPNNPDRMTWVLPNGNDLGSSSPS